jgi:hypothetical protein
MKTITKTIDLYRFDELDENAQLAACEDLNNGDDYSIAWYEANEAARVFTASLPFTVGRWHDVICGASRWTFDPVEWYDVVDCVDDVPDSDGTFYGEGMRDAYMGVIEAHKDALFWARVAYDACTRYEMDYPWSIEMSARGDRALETINHIADEALEAAADSLNRDYDGEWEYIGTLDWAADLAEANEWYFTRDGRFYPGA